MNKSILLGSALAVALSAPAMAADFHALKGLQGARLAPLQDGVLAATEGGSLCISAGGSAAQSGTPEFASVCLVADLAPATGGFAHFAVANSLDVAGAQFLQVVF